MDTNLVNERKEYRVGMSCVLASMIIWGLAPMYWRALVPVDSYVIIMYRILFAAVVCGIAAFAIYGKEEMKNSLGDKKNALKLLFAGFLVTINWGIYIYAVNSEQTIEASIGYYISPLVVCLLGFVFFKDRPTKFKIIAITFACIGVLTMLIYFMQLPMIALSLAVTFAMYAATKKHLKMKAIISLFYETLVFAIIALGILIYMESTGQGALHIAKPHQIVMLLGAGVISAVPLGLFSMAANRLNLITVGLMQYIGPSIGLLVGIFVFREPFYIGQLAACIFIWMGLAFFTYGEIRSNQIANTANNK